MNMFSGNSVVPLIILFIKCDIIEQEPYSTDIHLQKLNLQSMFDGTNASMMVGNKVPS